MSLYFQPGDEHALTPRFENAQGGTVFMLAVRTTPPTAQDSTPTRWLSFHDDAALSLLDLDTQAGREALADIITKVPLYRIALELAIDTILMAAQSDEGRMRGVKAAFAPDEPPGPVSDSMSEKYAFEGVLRFPIIASRSDLQLIELYLRLHGAATPDEPDAASHLEAFFGGIPDKIIQFCDGVLWHGTGWVRLERVIYKAKRGDHDPEANFENYVARGRGAAESMSIAEREALLAAWIQAERVQGALCTDIDSILRLPGIRSLPRWVRHDVFHVLEREAMKQVFAESLEPLMAEWSALKHNKALAEPIVANAKGEVAAPVQQLLNQTLSADARYAGSAGIFAQRAQMRLQEAERLVTPV